VRQASDRRTSPNADERPPGCAIDTLILHYTGMPSAAAALARLCDPAAKVSAHYLIDEDGALRALVPESRRAWHAGVSAWQGGTGLNDRSIGIELVNPGHEWGYRPFPDVQYAACIELCRALLERWPIPPRYRDRRRPTRRTCRDSPAGDASSCCSAS